MDTDAHSCEGKEDLFGVRAGWGGELLLTLALLRGARNGSMRRLICGGRERSGEVGGCRRTRAAGEGLSRGWFELCADFCVAALCCSQSFGGGLLLGLDGAVARCRGRSEVGN